MNRFLLYVFLLFTTYVFSNTYQVENEPNWVNLIQFERDSPEDIEGSYKYYLIDYQENVPKQMLFRHFAVEVLNAEGIQSFSNLNISFDPTYQTLKLHKLQIIRDGKIIDKLKTSSINTLQRETSLERSIYDGSLTTSIILNDIRKNDILEYSYTIQGFNPINKGNYTTYFYHQYDVPVSRVYTRAIFNKSKKINYKLFNKTAEPTIKTTGLTVEYIWDTFANDYKLYDTNTPSWFDIHKNVEITSYSNWEEVVNWGLPLYTVKNDNLKVKELQLDNLTKEQRIVKLIRFVQDEVRYFGFESGINSYKPHKPSKVLNQRYGDCKDKSLLLIALLNTEGVKAFPLLVNTTNGKSIIDRLPTPGIFNHCVVKIEFEGKDYFVDPTISNQGGDLSRLYFPDYDYGLLIKKGEKNLIELPKQNVPKLKIEEIIYINEIEGAADIEIKSTYSGSKADYIRDYFKNNLNETIQREYLDFYSILYPTIKLINDIDIYDKNRDSSNIVVVQEHYTVKDFWLKNKEAGGVYCEFYPLVLETLVNYPKSSERTMPYFLGNPHEYEQTTKVNLPEEWPIFDEDKIIEGDTFFYKKSINKKNDYTFFINHSYNLKSNYIAASSSLDFSEKHDEILNEFSHFLNYNKDLEVFKFSWLSLFISLITIVICGYFFIILYKNFNPEPILNPKNLKFGGWLILPIIGILISPFRMVYNVISTFFNANSWTGLLNSGLENATGISVLFGFELMMNMILLMLTIFIILMLFKKRTALPILISILYAATFAWILIDFFLAEMLFPDSYFSNAEQQASYKEMFQSAIACLIWIPYFNISKRVKNTFINKYNDK